jgi:hypothetical protein
MGLEFKSELERNPINQTPAPAPVDPCAEVKAELEMMTNFLQDNGYIMIYDNYKVMIEERARIEELERTSNGFEAV